MRFSLRTLLEWNRIAGARAMAFTCPACTMAASLVVSHSIELDPDLRDGSDELTLQAVACGQCGFRAAAVYEASRRGGGESVHHYCFVISAEDRKRLVEVVASQLVQIVAK